MASSFVAFPLQRLAIEEDNDRLLKALFIIADNWLPAFGDSTRTGGTESGIQDLADEALSLVHAGATSLGCDRYANLAVLYGACLGTGLGPPGVMVMGGAVRWDFVEDAERRAFDGAFKDSTWWPQ
jgi:hypothetical protein